MNSLTIRKTFLDFFKSKDHLIVPSASMVVKDDPTLMFTNAGMNQFKDIFLGNKPAKSKRVADTQKCLRVSGKHNDLEEVGIDTYHHTMFEMLGNWSFGDYFKKEAIEWGWELLTGVFGIDEDRLYVTVFEGDKKEGLKQDIEATEIWKKIIPEDRILFGSKKDNFWEMGDTGPCGPCSEIHVDIRDEADRKKTPGKKLVNKGNPLVIEIWNLVFIEFNRRNDGKLVPLPAKHVDTGMGFERLCMVLQHRQSNYDTDVFQPIIQGLSSMAGISYGSDPKADIAMRVIADHLRAIAFSIADGQLPSNVKAGYVIRRILRRALRYGYTFLGFKEPFINELVPVLVQQMGTVFPELKSQENLIIHVIKEEESAFLRTLATGIQRFNSYVDQQKIHNYLQAPKVLDPASCLLHPATNTIEGSFAFELYDTYGFPIDLTNLMAKEYGWRVDMEGFSKGLEEQKARSRQAASVEASDWTVLLDDVSLSQFVGYDTLSVDTEIIKYRKVVAKGETLYHSVLALTPFYAESGGQVGDRGWFISGNEKIEVIDTIRENDLIIHISRELFFDSSQPINAQVDAEKRRLTANNHSATHLLHSALRQVLGKHVEQKGSLVDENRLRFDFTHFTKMTQEEIRKVEMLVNTKIRDNIVLQEERSLPIGKAKEMGAMALFGEKYGDFVRVIIFDKEYSIELCGGTHVMATGQIGEFKIVSEGAIAAGIRRIEAITGEKAETFWNEKQQLINELEEMLKRPKDLVKSVKTLIEDNQSLKKQVSESGKVKVQQLKELLKSRVQIVNGINFLAVKVDLDAEQIKNLGWELNKEIPDLFLVMANESDGKAGLTVMLSESLVKEHKLNAGKIIPELAKEIHGGGGGQPHIATAGGKDPGGIPAALEKAKGFIPK